MKLGIWLIIGLSARALFAYSDNTPPANEGLAFEKAIKEVVAQIVEEKKPELVCYSDLDGAEFRIVVLDTRVKPETFEEYKTRTEQDENADGIHAQFRGQKCNFSKGEIRCPQIDLANIQGRISNEIATVEALRSEVFHLHFSQSGSRNSLLLYVDTTMTEGKRETRGRLLYSPLGSRKSSVVLETLTHCPIFPPSWTPKAERRD